MSVSASTVTFLRRAARAVACARAFQGSERIPRNTLRPAQRTHHATLHSNNTRHFNTLHTTTCDTRLTKQHTIQHTTHYTLHYTLHTTTHCTLHTAHYTLHTSHYTLHNNNETLSQAASKSTHLCLKQLLRLLLLLSLRLQRTSAS
jgi:hypothetical protein